MRELDQGLCEVCQVGAPTVTEDEMEELHSRIPDWHIIERQGAKRLVRAFRFKNFAEALAFANRVGALAEAAVHHPRLLVEWGRVEISWWTHKIQGLHRNDFTMAARTDELLDRSSGSVVMKQEERS